MRLNCLRPKQRVVIYDGGLRIESTTDVLYKDTWKRRYVVCQRRSGTEPPLVGLFKDGKSRESGEYLELFYMYNYIGYEYVGRKTKTLAFLMENRTLILSFHHSECMIFWKEWLREVCGRSFIFCLHARELPRTALLQLVDDNVRVHLTKTTFAIIQNSPPSQLICLRLQSLSRVESSDAALSFEANTHSFLKQHTFSFAGDGVQQMFRVLRLLLRPDQFAHSTNSNTHTNTSTLQKPKPLPAALLRAHIQTQKDLITNSLPLLPHAPRSNTPTIATATPAQTLPNSSRRRWLERSLSAHHYVNAPTSLSQQTLTLRDHHTTLSQSLISLLQQTSLASALTMPSEMEAFDDRPYHNVQMLEASVAPPSHDSPALPPPLPPRSHLSLLSHFDRNSFDSPQQSQHPVAEFANGNTSDSSSPNLSIEHELPTPPEQPPLTQLISAPPTSNSYPSGSTVGLVKPFVHEPLSTKRSGTSLNAKQLLNKVSGSFEQYDGEHQEVVDEDSEIFASVINSLPRSEKSDKQHRTSTNRIDYAVQKRREHLRERDKHMSDPDDPHEFIGSDSSSGSTYQPFPAPVLIRSNARSEWVQSQRPKIFRTPTDSNRTLINQTSFDDSISHQTAIVVISPDAASISTLEEQSKATPSATSLLNAESPTTRRRGNSTVSLPVGASALTAVHREDPEEVEILHGSAFSVQSEYNERVVFERGGRTRTSSRSAQRANAIKKVSAPLNYVMIESMPPKDALQNLGEQS